MTLHIKRAVISVNATEVVKKRVVLQKGSDG